VKFIILTSENLFSVQKHLRSISGVLLHDFNS